MKEPVPEPQSLWFARTGRGLADQARRLGLTAPSFISPPRATGVARTIRTGTGGCVVAVRLRGRKREQILCDLIEGIVIANRLSGPRSAVIRSQLWDVAADHLVHDADLAEPTPSVVDLHPPSSQRVRRRSRSAAASSLPGPADHAAQEPGTALAS